jgi:hypothetical protein
MKTLALNAYGVNEMNKQEMVEIDGGYADPNPWNPLKELPRLPELKDIIVCW